MAKNRSSGNLEALLGVRRGESVTSSLRLVSRDRIRPGAQPRRSFPPGEIAELAESIRQLHEAGQGVEGTGLLQPLLVTPEGAESEVGTYRLIAGERRWRACEIAGVERLPVVVTQTPDDALLLLQLVENLQRRDVPPLEEAQGLRQLMDERKLSLRDAAKLLGKGKGYLENRLSLLAMPPDVRELVSVRTDTLLHAREIARLPRVEQRAPLLRAVSNEGLSREEVRRRVEATLNPPLPSTPVTSQSQLSVQTDTPEAKSKSENEHDNEKQEQPAQSEARAESRKVSVQTDTTPDGTSDLVDGVLRPAANLLESALEKLGSASATPGQKSQVQLLSQLRVSRVQREAARAEVDRLRRAIERLEHCFEDH